MEGDVKKVPLNVHMYLTPICNLACRHCYYDALPVGAEAPALLTPDEIAKVITSICDAFDADFHVEGGEVFLREDLPDIFAAVPKAYWHYVTLTTSGTVRIRVDDADLCSLGDLRISVEGHTDDLQRLIRGVSLTTALNTCSELHRRGVPFTIRVTLFRGNIDQLHEMIDSLSRTGAERFSFYEFQGVGRGSGIEGEIALEECDVAEMIAALASRPLPASAKLIKVSLSASRVPIVEKSRHSLEKAGYELVNLGGVANLTINSNGDMGVSPWRITAHGADDYFSNLREVDLVSEVRRRLDAGLLNLPCQHTSQVMLRRKL